jgi:menaquinone-dependent protoporphyrinogen oxidase
MNGPQPRILVATASKHGATHEVGEEIARALREQGVDTWSPAEDVGDAEAFDGFVVGSVVYVGHWLDPVKKFVEKHAATLAGKPTWLFSSGPIGDPPRPNDSEAVNVDDLLTATGAKEHRVFAGKVDKSKLGFGERAVMRAVRAAEGDYRDWSEIRSWSEEIAAAL